MRLSLKYWNINPVNLICIALLIVVIGILSFKPAKRIIVQDEHLTANGVPVNLATDSDFEMLRDYQLQITDDGRSVIIYDGGRAVGASTLDGKCTIVDIILHDNE